MDNLSGIPWIHSGVIETLKVYINNDSKVLEFGSGNSTIFFSKLTEHLYSVEHNEEWYNKIKPKVSKNINYVLVPIDYISKPVFDNKFYEHTDVNSLFNCNIPDEYFDCILIDGIHRVNSTIASISKLKRGGMIILDDSNRIDFPASDGSYKPIENLLSHWHRIKFRSNERNTDIWYKP